MSANICYLPCATCGAPPDHDWRSGQGLTAATYKLIVPRSFVDDGSLYAAYQVIQALSGNGSSYWRMLAQYGCQSLAWGGYTVVPDGAYQDPEQWNSDPGTIAIHFTEDVPAGPYCGWHTADSNNCPYAVIYRPRTTPNCIEGSASNSLLSVVTHELAEALTDPVPGVSGNSGSGGEIGDYGQCVWRYATILCSDGTSRVCQWLWSEADGACWPGLPGRAV